jgi:branched-chain amino acid transport system ATP-binding protein
MCGIFELGQLICVPETHTEQYLSSTSPEEIRDMVQLIERLASSRTVILVEHKMKMVLGVSQRVVVLHHGELLADGTPDEIRNDADVKRVYLGQGRH